MPPPGIGEIVDSKYRIVSWLGEGGMGLIYEAEHLRLQQRVALKFMQPEALAFPEARARFDREARASARMRSPHFVRVLDVDTDAHGRPYIIMELLRGRDLEAELQARHRFPVAEAVDIVLQACEAVAEAHAAGIVHRDLKPSNIFLCDERGHRVVKVLDFGISTSEADAPASSPNSMGTPLYMSPEQVRAPGAIDAGSDLWALAVILFELLAGAPPFIAATPAAIALVASGRFPRLRGLRPDVPEALEQVIAIALSPQPSKRFRTAQALATALLPFAVARGESAGRAALAVEPVIPGLLGSAAPASSSRCAFDFTVDATPSRRSARGARPRREATGAIATNPAETGLGHRDALRTFLATMAIGMSIGAAALASGETAAVTGARPSFAGPSRSDEVAEARDFARVGAAGGTAARNADAECLARDTDLVTPGADEAPAAAEQADATSAMPHTRFDRAELTGTRLAVAERRTEIHIASRPLMVTPVVARRTPAAPVPAILPGTLARRAARVSGPKPPGRSPMARYEPVGQTPIETAAIWDGGM